MVHDCSQLSGLLSRCICFIEHIYSVHWVLDTFQIFMHTTLISPLGSRRGDCLCFTSEETEEQGCKVLYAQLGSSRAEICTWTLWFSSLLFPSLLSHLSDICCCDGHSPLKHVFQYAGEPLRGEYSKGNWMRYSCNLVSWMFQFLSNAAMAQGGIMASDLEMLRSRRCLDPRTPIAVGLK